jgi:quinoprotein glucose dehydrogenase
MVKQIRTLRSRLMVVLALAAMAAHGQENADWAHYHGSQEQTHYSTLNQINTSNIGKLKLAWRWDSKQEFKDSEMQSNPLVIGGVMYVVTPKLNVAALDAASGRELWRFDPWDGAEVRSKLRNRGLTHWNGRLYIAVRQWMYCLDAKTGRPVISFGQNGRIDLREGLGRPAESLNVSVSTPGVVFEGNLIVGSIVPEGLPSAPGDIRAFDLMTGKQVWAFHTIPHPGEFGYKTWPPEAYKSIGGANSWPGLALDEKRGLVFAGTGSAAFDFYGANRHGDNLFANCLLALDARTGKRKWHFQFVRHDVWDRDIPAPPTLLTISRGGRSIDAVAQSTKSGHVWFFERASGKVLNPYKNVAVPASDVDGEQLAKTQPIPLKPEPFARQEMTPDLVTKRTPAAHADVMKRYETYRRGPQFTPPSREGTIMIPGFDGGAEWGGMSFDPETRNLYINANEMAWILRLTPRRKPVKESRASLLYQQDCASCHKKDLSGSPPEFPALISLASRTNELSVTSVIRKGAGRMPGFAHYSEDTAKTLARFLLTGQDAAVTLPAENPYWLKYNLDGYIRFTDPGGYPALTPPWGTLSALNVDTWEYSWRIPFGEIPALAAQGMKDTGSENYGGGVVTAGGLLFIGATNADRKFRAYDKRTGRLLWEYELPAAGNASPATYMLNGRQYVVIGAGGGKWGNVPGGSYLAFAVQD